MLDKTSPASGAMEGGGAYNRHARLQAGGAFYALSLFEAAAAKISLDGDHPVVIADYGSSQGKNSLAPIRAAVNTLRSRIGPVRPIMVYHADLPVNDFRSLFDVVENDPQKYSQNDAGVFPCAIGRSFYRAILPRQHVDLAWCSYAAQWIREIPRVPLDHIWHVCMTGAARAAIENQAAQDWETFLTLRSGELRPGGRLVVAIPGARDDGSSGFERIMNFAYEALADMVAEGAIAADERGRMALGVLARRRRDLLAPFKDDETYCNLKVEHGETHEHKDAAWSDYERDGNLEALVDKHASFYRSTFVPTLASSLRHADDEEARRKFSDRLEYGLRQRLTAAPKPMNSLVETMMFVKLEPALSRFGAPFSEPSTRRAG
jgi:SAM dependent carboxyl methyltransferase